MSHFTVLVKVSGERLSECGDDINAAIEEMLAPYNEQPVLGSKYLEFEDQTELYKQEYESDTTEVVVLADGSKHSKYDSRFYKNGESVLPEGATLCELKVKEIYPDFGKYCQDHHGAKYNNKLRAWGFWRNPNAKWDWWVIGGRWTGFFPIKANKRVELGQSGSFGNKPETGFGDIVGIEDIDMDRVAELSRKEAEAFYDKYQKWLTTGEGDDPFCGPRHVGLLVGLVDVIRGPAEAKDGEVTISWSRTIRDVNDERYGWTDVCKILPDKDAFLRQYIDYFCPINTYAVLDDEGWHAPGEMGWWGMSSDTPGTKEEFVKSYFTRFIKTAKRDDRLVVVDCHI